MPLAPRLCLALYQPDIAANAGAMLRTCACLGAEAALIEPAGFSIDDPRFRRSAMDYVGAAPLSRHASWAAFEAWIGAAGRRLVLLTTKGADPLWGFAFRPGDVLMVGRESAGVPGEVAERADARLRIPLQGGMRSLNVSVAAGIALAEAGRQLAALRPGA